PGRWMSAEDDHLRAGRHAGIEIDDVLVDQSNAPGRNLLADGVRLDRAVQPEMRVAAVAVEIERSRAERIVEAARQACGIGLVALGLGADHVGGGRPARPLRLAADDGIALEL